MDLVWHIPGEGQDRIICASVDAGSSAAAGPIYARALQAPPSGHTGPPQPEGRRRGPGLQATSYILARSASFLREKVKDKGPALLFSDGALGLVLQAAWPAQGFGPLFIAVASAAQGNKARAVGEGVVLDESGPGFPDRLKAETGGKGFDTVLLASFRGVALRKALGAASVRGRVFLLLPPREPVRIDCHATINYKSLILAVGDPFARGLSLTERASTLAATRPPAAMEVLTELLWYAGAGENEDGDRFDWRPREA